MNRPGGLVPHFPPSVLVVGLVVTLLSLGGCNQGRRTPSGSQGASGTRSTGTSPVQAIAQTDPRTLRFDRVDMLITQWDVAQAGGRFDQAQALFDQIRTEVDAGFPNFAAAARGANGVSLQYLATSALGFSRRSEATTVLTERLQGRDARLVGNALIALKLRADPATPLEPILQHVVSSAQQPRRYAPLAIANVVDARYRAGRRTDPKTERATMHVLSSVVADRDPYVRLHTAKALGAFRAPASFELLMILIKDVEIRIRVAAAAGLERLGDHRGFPPMIRLLADAPAEAKPAIRDLMISFAQRIQGAPLSPAEARRFDVHARYWQEWFSAFCRQRGITSDSSRPPPTAPPVSQPPPPRCPPAGFPPAQPRPPSIPPPRVR